MILETLTRFRRMRIDARKAGQTPIRYELAPADALLLKEEDAARMGLTVDEYEERFGEVFTHLFGLPVATSVKHSRLIWSESDQF